MVIPFVLPLRDPCARTGGVGQPLTVDEAGFVPNRRIKEKQWLGAWPGPAVSQC
jgi:hypothetical protein